MSTSAFPEAAEELMLVVQILVTLVALWFTRLLWRRWKYDLHRIPSPPAWPFLGQTLDVVTGGGTSEIFRIVAHWTRALGYPKIFRVSVMGKDAVYVRDMECLKKVVFSRTDPLVRAVATNPSINTMLGTKHGGKGMAETHFSTPHVQAIRSLYIAAMSTRSLKAALPRIRNHVDAMIAIIESKRAEGPLEVRELCVMMTLDVIGTVAFGADFGNLDGSGNLHQLLLDVGEVAGLRVNNPLKLLQYKLFPYTQAIKKQQRLVEALHAEWDKLAEDVLAREDPPAGEQPIWYGLKKLTEPDTGEPISRHLLAYELGSVVIGGMDTTGHQLAWLLAALAAHPPVVQKLLDEFTERDLHGSNAREVTFEDLADMPYLTAVIKEGMRIACVFAVTLSRFAGKDMTFMGYRIPKGTLIFGAANRGTDSVEDWGDPEVFRPERWLTDEDMSQKYYLSFAYGARDCPGRRLAMLEMRLAIFCIVKQYELSLATSFGQIMSEARMGFVVEPSKGVWINAVPRDSA